MRYKQLSLLFCKNGKKARSVSKVCSTKWAELQWSQVQHTQTDTVHSNSRLIVILNHHRDTYCFPPITNTHRHTHAGWYSTVKQFSKAQMEPQHKCNRKFPLTTFIISYFCYCIGPAREHYMCVRVCVCELHAWMCSTVCRHTLQYVQPRQARPEQWHRKYTHTHVHTHTKINKCRLTQTRKGTQTFILSTHCVMHAVHFHKP